MKRRARLEVAALAALLPLWLVSVALHVDLVIRDGLTWVPLYVAPAPGSGKSPQVTGFWPETPLDDTSLRVGDRLLRVGDRSLVGASRLGVLASVYAASEGGVAHFAVERDGTEQPAELVLGVFPAPWALAPLVVGLGACGVVLWVRRRGSRAARACILAVAAYSFHWSVFLSGGGWRTNLGFALLVGAGALFGPLTLRAVVLFPERSRPPPRLARGLPWLFLVTGPLISSWLVGFPIPDGRGVSLLMANYAVMIVALFVTLAWTYQRSDAVNRRQLRWVVLGFYLGLAPVALAAALASWQPVYRPAYDASLLATLVIPVSIGIALTRYNLFDVDRLISSAAAYSILLIVFLALLLAPVPAAAKAVSELANLRPALVQTVFALVLASAVIWGERLVRPRLERLFFRERHAFENGVGELRVSLGSFETPGELLEALGGRLTRLLELQTCAIYAHSGERFAPIYTHGPGIPPGFDAHGQLATLLEDAERPVDASRWRRWSRRGLLGDLETAQLESLDANLVVPIRREGELAAFLCLGQKGSEDIYTPVDLALFEGLCDRVSLELQRFDAAALERAERERWERLAGYVPAAVREGVDRPAEVAPGEREVSVLFVDIRGYTAFSEGRSPDEIFRVVNAYTESVSGVIRDHGGWVVEFQGDGLMAVFGAPRELQGKEGAAIEAAFDVVNRVEHQGIEALPDLDLQVGVGVATGLAYVGNVQSVDRQIWCVIGNTTNLAARLQAMTRDLGVSIVIDATTCERGGAAAEAFSAREDVRVRGRSEAMTIYLAEPVRAAA